MGVVYGWPWWLGSNGVGRAYWLGCWAARLLGYRAALSAAVPHKNYRACSRAADAGAADADAVDEVQ